VSPETTFVGLDDIPSGFGDMYKKGDVVSGKDSLDVFWIEPLDESLSSTTYTAQSHSEDPAEMTNISARDVMVSEKVPTPRAAVMRPLERTKASLVDFINEGSYVEPDRLMGGRGRGVPRRVGLHRRQVPNLPSADDLSNRVQNRTSQTARLPNTRQRATGYGINRVDETADPRYTIPDLSLLANSTAITALVGKVYLDNRVNNPRYFKIKVGRDNVTSNGHRLPREIAGTIMEGYAVGEYSTSCVRGVITAATFVFRDGTVRTMYPGDVGTRPSSNNVERMGYIADQWGNDCIPGILISDGHKYLASSFAAAGLAGYAEAWRIAQQNRREILSPNGTSSTVTSVPPERVREFAEASALAGGIEEVVKYVRERYGISTDLVYLPAGQKVDVHIQQELRVDVAYSPRKLRHHFRETAHVKESFD